MTCVTRSAGQATPPPPLYLMNHIASRPCSRHWQMSLASLRSSTRRSCSKRAVSKLICKIWVRRIPGERWERSAAWLVLQAVSPQQRPRFFGPGPGSETFCASRESVSRGLGASFVWITASHNQSAGKPYPCGVKPAERTNDVCNQQMEFICSLGTRVSSRIRRLNAYRVPTERSSGRPGTNYVPESICTSLPVIRHLVKFGRPIGQPANPLPTPRHAPKQKERRQKGIQVPKYPSTTPGLPLSPSPPDRLALGPVMKESVPNLHQNGLLNAVQTCPCSHWPTYAPNGRGTCRNWTT